PGFSGMYGLMLFAFCAFLSSAIAVIVSLTNGLKFIPDGLGFLMGISLPTLIISIILFIALYGSKQGIFKINKDCCTLNSKIKGEAISIKINNTDIQRIEIVDFSKTHRAVCIVLIDGIGTYGKTVFTRKGEYIKLRYTKRRLKKIQEFLPDKIVCHSYSNPFEISFR
ncbi:MAG: hypothetical protein K2N22_00165, partial [Clostridia bacterium]|nr:hypothetical protein [Clostridia bacterium]